MFFRKPKNKKVEPVKEEIKSKTAGKVAAFILTVQNGFAGVMGKWVNGLSIRGRKIFAFLFCIVFGSYSLYLLATIFLPSDAKEIKSLMPDGVSVPKHFDRSGDENISPAIISEHDFEKINEFNHYMDSLKLSPSGRRTHDSIISKRPGLMDSIRTIEQLYYLQKQNK